MMMNMVPLAPYVPRSVLSRLARGILLEGREDHDDDTERGTRLMWPLKPHFSPTSHGAVFLLDLSGYTKFASSCQGGADQVARVVNGIFRQMIAVVHSFSECEVVKFCGDALLCLCTAEEALETAVACSLAVQEKVFSDTSTTHGLSLHVGVAAGDFVELFVGGDRLEHMISGMPLAFLGEAVDAATSGQVVVHGSVELQKLVDSGRLQGNYIGPEDEQDAARFFLATTCANTLASTDLTAGKEYLPASIEHKLRGRPDLARKLNDALVGFTPLNFVPGAAEFRQCSILFAALPDFDPSDEDEALTRQSFQDTQTIVQELQRCLDQYGGNMRQLLRDDKGTVAIAIFGLPTRSHEDDAVRAIKTAQTLTSRTPCRAVGVATGDVFVGLVGCPEQRCEYSAVGDTANMAARLMCACPKLDKLVLVCPATHAAAVDKSTALQFEENKQVIVLKGKGSCDVFVPLGDLDASASARRSTSRFLGKSRLRRTMSKDSSQSGNSHRYDEEKQEEDSFSEEGAIGGQVRSLELSTIIDEMPGGSVCLVADAGAGKSTLAASFAEHAVEAEIVANVVYAAADSTETETPLFAFKYLINELCKQLGGPEVLCCRCGLDPKLASLLNPLLEASMATTVSHKEVESLGNKARREKTVELVVAVLKFLVETGTGMGTEGRQLLVIEDLHWMDDLSSSVLKELSRSECSLLATSRYLPPSLEEGIVREIRVKPLSLAEAQIVATSSLFAGTLSEKDVAILLERSEGNALFFTEMLRAAASGGKQVSNLPSTVRGVLVSRIDALSPRCIEFLKAASVFGRTFSSDTTMKLVPNSSAPEIAELEQIAIAEGIIERVDVWGNVDKTGTLLRFGHALGQEAAYSLITRGVLAALHDQAAEIVQSSAQIEHHRAGAVDAQPTSLRAELAVEAIANGARDHVALGAISLKKAQEKWKQARGLLRHVEDPQRRRELELLLALDEGRALVAWDGFASAAAEECFASALRLVQRGKGSVDEILALSGLWMNAMCSIGNADSARRALAYAEELRETAVDPDCICCPSEMKWTVKEIYHVVWTEYGRRGRLREMRRFLDPVLQALTPHRGKSVLGHNAETCATIFGAKVSWLQGRYNEALQIATSGKNLTDETFSIAHSRIWGVATVLAWNVEVEAMNETLSDPALVSIPPFHLAVKGVLHLARDIMEGAAPLETVHERLLTQSAMVPWGEFPFTVSYALIQRGYAAKLDDQGSPRVPDLCKALRLVLGTWKRLRDSSDGWGPGLFQWVGGMHLLFSDPECGLDSILCHFDAGVKCAEEEDAVGVVLLIETSRLRLLSCRRSPHLLDACERLVQVRDNCTGDANVVAPLAWADEIIHQVQAANQPSVEAVRTDTLTGISVWC